MATTNYANASQIIEIENTIIDILNSGDSGAFGGAITDKRRSAEAISSARRKAVYEIVEAIAMNPAHGFWQSLAVELDVESGTKLPEFLGALGVPQIIAFEGADSADGLEERPEIIDYYRSSNADNLSQTLNDQPLSAHNLPYISFPSRGAGRYSIRSNKLKFTGFSCVISLVKAPETDSGSSFDAWCDSHLPAIYAPACIALAFQYLVKEGDNIFPIAQGLVSFGKSELNKIRSGAMAVEQLPKISDRQRIIR